MKASLSAGRSIDNANVYTRRDRRRVVGLLPQTASSALSTSYRTAEENRHERVLRYMSHPRETAKLIEEAAASAAVDQ